MASQKVKNYVKKALSKGFSKNSIQLKLLDAGIKIEEIEKIFEEVGKQNVAAQEIKPLEKKEELPLKDHGSASDDINDLFDDLEAKAQKLNSSNMSYDEEKKADLTRYIKQELKKGIHPRKLYFSLVRHRHDPETIKNLIEQITASQEYAELHLPPPITDFKSNSLNINKNVVIYSLITLLVIGVAVATFFFLTKTECVTDSDCEELGENAFCFDLPDKKPVCLQAEQKIIEESKNIMFKAKDSFLIKLGNNEIILHLDRFESNKAKIIIHPENEKISLGPGDSKRIDISGDDREDLYLELIHFQEEGALIFFDEITPIINIRMKTISDTYNVDQPFSAMVNIESEITHFEAVVRYTKQKQGTEQKIQYIVRGNTNTNIIRNRELLAIENQNGQLINKESFSEPGTYEYSVEIYSCDGLSEENINCEDIALSELDEATPLIKQQKIIKVK